MITMCHMADLHGRTKYIPDCDILTISGDICPNFEGPDADLQFNWLIYVFEPWLRERRKGRPTLLTWGNHDLIGYCPPPLPNVTYLVDEAVTIEGITFYGTPWTVPFGRKQAFMVPEERLAERFDAIPDCDVLIAHSPPLGYGDLAPNGERVGSLSMLRAIERVKPQLTVFGHIHEGNGIYNLDICALVNAAVVDADYHPVRDIYISKWDDGLIFDLSPIWDQRLREKLNKR